MLQIAPAGDAHLRPGGWTIMRIDSLEGIESLRSEWRALEARAADPLAYFQSYDWCRTWCAHFAVEGGGGPAIRIYAAYLSGRLSAIWPLMLSGERFARKLTALTEPHGQYGNILIDPDAASPGMVAELVGRCLRMIDRDDRADVVLLDNVPDYALPEGLCAMSGLEAAQVGVNSSLDLTRFDGCFEAYRASLKSRTRRARNKRRNKLATLGALDYRVHFGGTPEYAELVRVGLSMKRTWLAETGRATRALNLPNVPEFLGALSNNRTGDNGAVAAALMLDGRPIAIEIGFLYHRRFYSYLGAFDWDLRDYSPGKLQLEDALRWCLANGVQIYDLLGEPASYKSDWCNLAEPLWAYRTANSVYGQAYLNVWHDNLRPFLKRSFEQMPLGLRSRLIPMIETRACAAPK